MTGETIRSDGGEQNTSLEDVADTVRSDIGRLIETKSDVDPDDILETELRMSRHHRSGPGGGSRVLIGYSATTVIASDDFVGYRDRYLAPEVDKRKCPHPKRKSMGVSVTIGRLKYTGEGEIIGHEIDPEYRRGGDE